MIKALVGGVRGATLRLQAAPVVGQFSIRGKHGELLDREKADQHPIDAINGLREALNERAKTEEIPQSLPNPKRLILTNGVSSTEYDGTKEVTVRLNSSNGQITAGQTAYAVLFNSAESSGIPPQSFRQVNFKNEITYGDYAIAAASVADSHILIKRSGIYILEGQVRYTHSSAPTAALAYIQRNGEETLKSAVGAIYGNTYGGYASAIIVTRLNENDKITLAYRFVGTSGQTATIVGSDLISELYLRATYLGDASAGDFEPDGTIDSIVDTIYPIGAIYVSADATSPAARFGGTWEQIKDAFLLAAGDTFAAGEVGGEASHLLTLEEMPSHEHGYNAWSEHINTLPPQDTYKNTISVRWDNHWAVAGELLYPSGRSQPHNNMPPYMALYMWKRIA